MVLRSDRQTTTGYWKAIWELVEGERGAAEESQNREDDSEVRRVAASATGQGAIRTVRK